MAGAGGACLQATSTSTHPRRLLGEARLLGGARCTLWRWGLARASAFDDPPLLAVLGSIRPAVRRIPPQEKGRAAAASASGTQVPVCATDCLWIPYAATAAGAEGAGCASAARGGGAEAAGETKNVSVIVPIYNEVESLPNLVARIGEAMQAESARFRYEIVLVDDGSCDGSVGVMRSLAAERGDVTGVFFRRNFGQTAAMAAGFAEAQGDVLVTLDGDLQNDPADIPRLLDELLHGGEQGLGYDMVCGWRKQRKDNVLLRNFPSAVANRLIAYVTGVKLNDYGCSLKAYTSELGKMLRPYGELHRYLPALANIHGASISEMVVTHRAREMGVSKYSALGRIPRVVMDLITVWFLGRFLDRPMHAIGLLGFLTAAAGAGAAACYLLVAALAASPLSVAPYAAAAAGVARAAAAGPVAIGAAAALAGVQLMCLGVVAEVVSRTYFESQGLTRYRVREVVRAATAGGWD